MEMDCNTGDLLVFSMERKEEGAVEDICSSIPIIGDVITLDIDTLDGAIEPNGEAG